MTTVILNKFLRKLSAYPNGLKDFKDNIDVLVTLNADRRQHNEKRNKRRDEATNGGSDENIDAVSDDEDDYLAPIIHALNKSQIQRPLQAIQSNHYSEISYQRKPTRNCLASLMKALLNEEPVA